VTQTIDAQRAQLQYSVLLDILDRLASTRTVGELTEVLPSIADAIRNGVEAEAACILLSLDGTRQVYANAPDQAAMWVESGDAVLSGVQAVLDPKLDALEKAGIRRLSTTPIRSGEIDFGVLAVGYTTQEKPDDSRLTFLLRVAGQMALALDRARTQERLNALHANHADFVDTVLHDLRSPLTFMQGYADMLPMVGEMNTRQREFVDKIVSGISQVKDLVEKSLDAGRLDPQTGFYVLSRELCDLSSVVTDLVSTHAQAAEKRGQKLIGDISPDLPLLYLDVMLMRRALNNLVDNAIKYTPEGGTITVGAHVRDESVYLSVQDTGLGISPENQQHLFERFRRVHRPEHQRVKGSGLGLFVVKNVAVRHDGDAWVESTENVGSTFIIRIPIDGANLPSSAANQAVVTPKTTA